MKLKRFEGNPILEANPNNPWEDLCVCNPGAWEEDGTVYLLYRCAGDDIDHRIYLGLATSKDGLNFTRCFDHPVLSPTEGSFDGGCVEDPRISKIDDVYYVTYAYRPFPPGRYWEYPVTNQPLSPNATIWGFDNNITSTGLAATKDFRTFLKMGRITVAGEDDRDVLLFPGKAGGKYVRLNRSKSWVGEKYGCLEPSIWLGYSDNLLEWPDVDHSYMLMTAQEPWEFKMGASAPPIRTDRGWFMIYHAVDENGVYRAGAAMLDLENPHKVIGRTKTPILEPEANYETDGLLGAVFPTGNVVINGTLYVYYGGADSCCCVATADFETLIDAVLNNE